MRPHPTPILRLIHIDNLHVCLCRGRIHAPNFTPNDGLRYRTIHNVEVQQARQVKPIPCGPGGVVHDYVPFYFGYLSPMMLNLKTGRVPGYDEGQDPLIYLITTCQAIRDSRTEFVFTDGHGIAAWTEYFDDLAQLDQLDWDIVYQRYWRDTDDDPDRQRRKQAEFLVHRSCDWSLIQEIAVIDEVMKSKVEQVMAAFPPKLRRAVRTQRDWYYY